MLHAFAISHICSCCYSFILVLSQLLADTRLLSLCLKFNPFILKVFRRALLLIFELQALCSTHCVGKFVCFISASNVTYNGPLVLYIKPKAKETFCTAVMLVFFIQRKCCLNKSCIYFPRPITIFDLRAL